jgi:plasmid maintenance system antidote protein VapI
MQRGKMRRMKMISRKLKEAVKLSDMKAYEIAHMAGVHPTTLSRILNGIEEVTLGDPRVIRIAKVIGLKPQDCFENSKTAWSR